MNISKKDFFTIPNILSYFRILMIPVFAVTYLRATTLLEYRIAAAVLAVSSITDTFDGLIARKCNMITDLGKVLDPTADKLTHATVGICLATRHPQMWMLVILIFIKEITQLIVCWNKWKKERKKMSGAQWYGKICTTVLFVVFVGMILFPFLSEAWVNGLTIGCFAVTIATFCLYMRDFHRL